VAGFLVPVRVFLQVALGLGSVWFSPSAPPSAAAVLWDVCARRWQARAADLRAWRCGIGNFMLGARARLLF
jgi:hypothetical protein